MTIEKLSDAIEYALKNGIYSAKAYRKDDGVSTQYMCSAMSTLNRKGIISESLKMQFCHQIQDHVDCCARRAKFHRGVDSPLISTIRIKDGNSTKTDAELFVECEKHYRKWLRDLKRRGK